MEIRRARPEDVPLIVPLWRGMMDEHRLWDKRFDLSAEADSECLAQMAEMLRGPDTAAFLAEEDGVVLGYLLALVLENPPMFSENKYGFIAEMAVTPEYRRQGLGRELWDRAKRWLLRKGVRSVQLNVSGSNAPGLALWNSLGFEEFLKILWLDLDESDSAEEHAS